MFINDTCDRCKSMIVIDGTVICVMAGPFRGRDAVTLCPACASSLALFLIIPPTREEPAS